MNSNVLKGYFSLKLERNLTLDEMKLIEWISKREVEMKKGLKKTC